MAPGSSHRPSVLRQFAHAWNGLVAAWRVERSFRIEAAVAVLTVAAGLAVGLSRVEWLFVLGAIGGVLALELLNTMIEKTLDHLHPAEHDAVRFIKDVAAAAVLIAGVTALIIGLAVFVPHVG